MHASLLIELHDPLLCCRTYSIPWQKHGVRKSMPTSCSVCSCALLTVIAKQGRIGNCSLLNWKGSSLSEEVLSSPVRCSCADAIRQYVSVYPLPARPELLYLSFKIVEGNQTEGGEFHYILPRKCSQLHIKDVHTQAPFL